MSGMARKSVKGPAGEPVDAGEILPECDFQGETANKFAARYLAGCRVVVLEPDVAGFFRSSEEANAALRALAGIVQRHRDHQAGTRRKG